MLVKTVFALAGFVATLAAPCEPSPSTSEPPSPSPSTEPPIYIGRPFYWNWNLSKCMGAKGTYNGAPVIL